MICKKVQQIISNNLKVIIEDDLISKELVSLENFSSLTHLFIISDIEQEFKIQFAVDEIEKIKTIDDFIIVINSKLNK
jgi:acyl carrier protein